MSEVESLLESSFDYEERIYSQVKEEAVRDNNDIICNILSDAKYDRSLRLKEYDNRSIKRLSKNCNTQKWQLSDEDAIKKAEIEKIKRKPTILQNHIVNYVCDNEI